MIRNSPLFSLAITSLLALGANAQAQDRNLLDPTFKQIQVASGCKFTEGPALDGKGNLYFSDGENDRIMKLSPSGELSVFRHPCGRANGLLFDLEGHLLMCQSTGNGGGRRVTRLEADGSETILAESIDGKRLIGPNDLCQDQQGRIYFTDPNYGQPSDDLPPSSVYRIDAPGKITRVIGNLARPNGILLTPDGKYLYVSDRGSQKLHRYRVVVGGDLEHDRVLYDFSPDRGIDGMWLDVEGNIYGAAGEGDTTGLFVISPEGKLLLHRPMPEFSTNVIIGGADGRDLYLTASTSVYKLRTTIAGAKLPPATK